MVDERRGRSPLGIDTSELGRRLRIHAREAGFSGVVCVARADEVVFCEAAGYRHLGESLRIDTRTRFPLASGSKLFTALAIVQLIERGQLAFDTRLVERVDTKLPWLDPRITVEQLLRHTSGIRSYFEADVDPDYEALWRHRPSYAMRSPRDFLPMFADKSMKFEPGACFDYNDGGYILLGMVIEAVTGARFAEHVEEHVLRRAGMAESGYFSIDRLPFNAASAYIRDPDGSWRSNLFAIPARGGGDGGAYASAPDLARLWHALVTHQLIGEAMTAQLLAPTPTRLAAPTDHYGLGVWIQRVDGASRQISVEGSDPGVSMISGWFPASGLSLTVLCNTGAAVRPLYQALDGVLNA